MSKNKSLEAKLRNAEWRRNKYWSNPEFRELEKSRSREYQRKKREKENKESNQRRTRNEIYN